MKKAVVTGIALILLLSASAVYSLDSGHIHITGIIDATGTRTDTIPIDTGRTRTDTYYTVTVAGVMYKVDQKCVIYVETENDGRFVRKNGTFSDVLPGKSVTARRIARTLHEIIVEEWKK